MHYWRGSSISSSAWESSDKVLETDMPGMDLRESVSSQAASAGGHPQRLWPVAAFTFAYLVGALAIAAARGNLEFLYYIAVMVGLIGVVSFHTAVAGRDSSLRWPRPGISGGI